MLYLSETLHSLHPFIPLHVVNTSGHCSNRLTSTPVSWFSNQNEVVQASGLWTLSRGMFCLCDVRLMAWPKAVGRLALTAAMAAVMCLAGSGQGLSPAVNTTIVFHGSSLICWICHCRGGLLSRALNRAAMVHRLHSPSYGHTLLTSLSL